MRFKLYPNQAQIEQLESWNRLHCELYNACLQERRDAYKKCGQSLTYYDQQNQLPAVKEARPEYKKLGSQALQETVRRVDRAYQGFFRRVKKGETPGFPRFKSGRSYVGFTYPALAGWKFELGETGKHGTLNITHLGRIKARGKPRQWGELRCLTLNKIGGEWYATITIRCHPKRQAGKLAAGVDFGVARIASLSDGTLVENPRFLKKAMGQLGTLSRELARRKRFGSNWRRTKAQMAKLHAKVANQRADFQHQLTSDLVGRYGVLVTEDLSIKRMTAKGGAYKTGLNRAILDVGMRGILQKLECKALEAGTLFLSVPTRLVKPSQTCPVCGNQSKKTLAERVHQCECGYTEDRDVVAAQVMLQWALANCQELAGRDTMAAPGRVSELRNPEQTAPFAVGRG